MFKSLKIIKEFNERIVDWAFEHSQSVAGISTNNNLNFDSEMYEIFEDGSIEATKIYSDWRGDTENAYCIISQNDVMNLLAEIIDNT